MTETVATQSEDQPQAEDQHRAEDQSQAEDQPQAQAETQIDLRRTGINPDFWYPVAVASKVRKGKTFAATFAGQRIALYRGESGAVYALEDRCAHRQVPLSMGVVEGDVLRCCYHAWAYRGNGRISQIPYLPKGAAGRRAACAPTRSARPTGSCSSSPATRPRRTTTPLPDLPQYSSPKHKTMTFSRTVACHYSFMHENLLDMNHQFLHRGIVGRIQPKLLGYTSGPQSVEARYLFTHGGGKRNRGANLLAADGIKGGSKPERRHHHAPGTPTRPSSSCPRTPNSRCSPSGSPTCPRTPSSAPTTSTACS